MQPEFLLSILKLATANHAISNWWNWIRIKKFSYIYMKMNWCLWCQFLFNFFFCLSCIVCMCSMLPPTVLMSLCSSSLNGYFPLPHIALFSLALMSSSQCLSLWPSKVKSHHVFPSCSPPTMWWSSEPPTGGIKHMIYRAPSKTKRGKRKKMKDQFPSSVVLGFTAVVIL